MPAVTVLFEAHIPAHKSEAKLAAVEAAFDVLRANARTMSEQESITSFEFFGRRTAGLEYRAYIHSENGLDMGVAKIVVTD